MDKQGLVSQKKESCFHVHSIPHESTPIMVTEITDSSQRISSIDPRALALNGSVKNQQHSNDAPCAKSAFVFA